VLESVFRLHVLLSLGWVVRGVPGCVGSDRAGMVLLPVVCVLFVPVRLVRAGR
jgi:hypothetical protein